MGEVAKLILDGKEYELPIRVGTEGNRVIDISKLYQMTGYITLDDGFANTGGTTSSITYIDGEKGILRYRGYRIEELAERCDFLEVAYLLIYGELPTADQLEEFRDNIRRHTLLQPDVRKQSFRCSLLAAHGKSPPPIKRRNHDQLLPSREFFSSLLAHFPFEPNRSSPPFVPGPDQVGGRLQRGPRGQTPMLSGFPLTRE